MKTLKDHLLVFDAECPICTTYSKAFVQTGMLASNGREAYQQLNQATCSIIDQTRACNEIALVNIHTGEVSYGIDSIIKIIGHNFKALSYITQLRPIYWLLKRLYYFISYNRKVMIPSNPENDTCIPDVNVPYRWAYLVFTWIFTSSILSIYSSHLTGIVPASRFFREFIICGGQIVFQSVLMFFLNKQKTLEYLGNMMSISFAGALLLLLWMGITQLIGLTSAILFLMFFMLVVLLMFLEHIRRMKLLKISLLASIGWMVYRLLVLTVIL